MLMIYIELCLTEILNLFVGNIGQYISLNEITPYSSLYVSSKKSLTFGRKKLHERIKSSTPCKNVEVKTIEIADYLYSSSIEQYCTETDSSAHNVYVKQ